MKSDPLFHDVLRATGFLIGDEPAPGLVLNPSSSTDSLRSKLDAIWRDRSNIEVLFKYSKKPPTARQIASWHRNGWNLGVAPLLWIVSPQRIEVYNTFDRPTSTEDAGAHLLRVFTIVDAELARLDDYAGRLAMASGRFWTNEQRVQSAGRVDQQLLADLQALEDRLADDGLSRKVAQSLLGRTIFLRYLADRGIVGPSILKEFGSGSLDRLLSERASAYRLFDWIRTTFNGDLFPIEAAERRSVKSGHLQLVAATLSGMNPTTGQTSLWPYRFDVIPIELISSIYEQFAHTASTGGTAKEDGLHYTPVALAGLVLDEVMRDLPAGAKILDMTCGSGVFLVEALRRLVYAQAKGKPPSRHLIRSTLKKQIFGADKNAAAISIASFSLYLTVLELDPNPRPPNALRFEPLVGHNLFIADSLRLEEQADTVTLCNERFDVIVGNPPWTYAKSEVVPTWPEHSKPNLPPRSQDFAFVWKSMELAHDSTRFGIVMRGTPFFSSARSSLRARNALIQRLAPVVLVNLAALRDDLFPTADYPAVVLFARLPGQAIDCTLPIISIPWTATFARSGAFEISPSDVRVAPVNQIFSSGYALKTFALGTPRDRLLMRKLHNETTTLSELLDELDLSLVTGVQLLRGDRKDASHLLGMPLLDSGELELEIDVGRLEPFSRPEIHRPRDPSAFRAPLLLVGEGVAEGRLAVGISHADIVYSRSFYGISFSGQRKRDADLQLTLFGILQSAFVSWHLLLTASEFGIHKRKILLQDLLELRMPSLDVLQSPEGREVANAVRSLDIRNKQESERTYEHLDNTVSTLFHLKKHERLVVSEGLNRAKAEYVGPRQLGDQPLTVVGSRQYATAFLEVLNAWSIALDRSQFDAEILNVRSDAALRAVRFVAGGHGKVRAIDLGSDLNEIIEKLGKRMNLPIAERLAVGRELRVHADGELFIIKPVARRYWSPASGLNDADAALGDGLEGPSP